MHVLDLDLDLVLVLSIGLDLVSWFDCGGQRGPERQYDMLYIILLRYRVLYFCLLMYCRHIVDVDVVSARPRPLGGPISIQHLASHIYVSTFITELTTLQG